MLQQGSGSLTLDNVIVTGGNLQQFLGDSGGAIDAQGGVTVMNYARVTGNSISAINAQGGAIYAAGVGVTNNSTIDHNSASASNAAGGAIGTLGAVTVTDSTVSNNTANGFFAAQGGAIDAFSGVTVTRSTMSDNTAVSNGTSIGGAFDSGVGAATVTESTLSGNKASALPCCNSTIAQGGAFRANRAVTVTNSTLSGNSATAANGARGGAIFAFGQTPPSAVTVTNSTITDNTTSNLGGGIWTDFSLITVYSTVVSNSAPTGANVELERHRDPDQLRDGDRVTPGRRGELRQPGRDDFERLQLLGRHLVWVPRPRRWRPHPGHVGQQRGPDPDAVAPDGQPAHRRDPERVVSGRRCLRDHDRPARPPPPRYPGSPDCDIGAVEVQPPAPTPPTVPSAVVIEPRFAG